VNRPAEERGEKPVKFSKMVELDQLDLRRMEDGGWRMEDGGWRMEDGGWRMEDKEWRIDGILTSLNLLNISQQDGAGLSVVAPARLELQRIAGDTQDACGNN
jgi:hypothetical protein